MHVLFYKICNDSHSVCKHACQELKECNKDKETSGLQAKLVSDDDFLHWKGEIKGPQGTPYESGKFVIDINLPNDYPFVPPKVCDQCGSARLLPSAALELEHSHIFAGRTEKSHSLPSLARCRR